MRKTRSTPVTTRHQYLVTHTPPHHISRLLPLIYHHTIENLRIGDGVEAPAVLEALEAVVEALERRTPGGFGRAEHLGRSSSRFWAGKQARKVADRRLDRPVSSEYRKASAHYKHGVSRCPVLLTTSTALWYTVIGIPALLTLGLVCIWQSGRSELGLCCNVRGGDEEL